MQTRSEVKDPCDWTFCPAPHVRRARQDAERCDVLVWYVSPEQDSHVRSALGDPWNKTFWPAPQVPRLSHALNVWLTSVRNVSPSQVAHWRSLHAVHCAVMRWPTPHILHAVHLRSSSAVGSAIENCGHGHSERCVLQMRLLDAVGSPDSYSSASQVVTGAQGSPLTASEYVPPSARG